MAAQTITTNTNVDVIDFRSNDTLVINNGATVTVNTNQTKFWSGITINNGKLRIENSNTGTTGAIRFTTGRVSGAAAQSITPASGLGIIEVAGNWINIGVGDGTASKELTVPYTDYIPALWVQTATGSTIYEIWLNATGVYGGSLGKFIDGFEAIGTGARGKFFVQKPNPTQNNIIILTGCTTVNTSRTIQLPTTAGLYVGASIDGSANIAANSVIETIINSTGVTINAPATGNASTVTCTIYNPFSQQFLPTVIFGNGTNGNILTSGVTVRIPNIMLTSDTPNKIQALSSQLGTNIVMTAGGILSLDKCLMDEVYMNLTQAQTATLTNVGVTVPPTISECYDLTMNSVGFGLTPVRRYYSSGWFQRDARDLYVPIDASYINDAIFNDVAIVCNNPTVAAGTAIAPISIMRFGNSNNLSCTNIRLYKLQQYGTGHYGISTNAPVMNSVFTNIETYGVNPVALYLSSDNTFTNVTFSTSMFDSCMGWTAGSRFGYDPNTGNNFIDGQPYYFKSRTYYTRDRSLYGESQYFSATPFTGSTTFPDYFTCYCNADRSVTMNWPERRHG